jgi:hypothetical protein
MSGRRIELSATQVIASMLAAVTGAIAASYAGIAGTMVGVAVMSVASTAGAAVYKHYLGRSKERLRSAAVVIAPVIAPRAGFNGTARRDRGTGPLARAPGEHARAAGGDTLDAGDDTLDAGNRTLDAGDHARVTGDFTRAGSDQGGAAGDHGPPPPGQLSGWPWSPDAPVTDEFPAVSGETTRWTASPAGEAATPAGPWRAATASTDHAGQEQDNPDRVGSDRSADGAGFADSAGPGGRGAEGAGPGGRGAEGAAAEDRTGREAAGTAGRPGGRRRWLAMAGAAAGVFVLTLGGITAFEVAAGKPLDALIWGRHTSGTTVGDVTGAQHARPAPRPTPQRATPAPSRLPTGSPTPTPSPSSSTPAPTPSPSPSLSSPAPAPVSPSPSGSAGR